MSDRCVVIEWSEVYTDPLPYAAWHKEASKGLRPPIGLVLHNIKEVPRNGAGNGEVLLSSNDPGFIRAHLDTRCDMAQGDRAFSVEDALDSKCSVPKILSRSLVERGEGDDGHS